MKEIEKIYLSWRKGQGFRRHIVGILQQSDAGKYTFDYQKESIPLAEKEGFTPYYRVFGY